MILMLSAIAFVILLTVLILIHELGHYLLARYFGVEVEEFGFGLPPKIKTLFTHAGTAFTLNWVPFGGFVRLKGENVLEGPDRLHKGSFAAASSPARFAILSGGVIMNFLLAIALLTAGFSFGRWIPSWYTSIEALQEAKETDGIMFDLRVLIAQVEPESPAAKAGIEANALIVAVNGKSVSMPDEVIALQKDKTEVTYTLSAHDGSDQKDVTVSLRGGRAGISIQPAATNVIAPKRPIVTGFSFALQESWFMAKQTVSGIGNLLQSLFIRGRVPEGIAGIVGIAMLTHGSVQEGFMTYLRLVALLSLSLAILNVLPLPALDGGRILFVIVEAITRRPINRRFELMTNAVGFFFIITLIVVITFNDIVHLF